ncbi:unnamed protein product [Closterium sp. Naga37s-1]|nr:unnamed protein product [Closterium sp. Naga37s-1]
MIAFPNSTRVGRLEGMWLEAKGWWDQADKVYSDLLESNPQDQRCGVQRCVSAAVWGAAVWGAAVWGAAVWGAAVWGAAVQECSGAGCCSGVGVQCYMVDYEAWKVLGDLYRACSLLQLK